MLLYLKHAWEARLAAGTAPAAPTCSMAIREGAVLRVRPKAMTVAVIIAGSAADHVEPRHRLGGHAADRGADGRRHDHRAAAIDVRSSLRPIAC